MQYKFTCWLEIFEVNIYSQSGRVVLDKLDEDESCWKIIDTHIGVVNMDVVGKKPDVRKTTHKIDCIPGN